MRFFSIQSLIVVFMSLFAQQLSAQELEVKSFELESNDTTAIVKQYQRFDNNSNLAGLVKVIIPREGVEFDGGMVLDQRKWTQGEYWVWMADRATKLTVRVPGFQALELNFRNYDFNMLHSKNTYKLVITVQSIGVPSHDDGLGFIVMKVEPKNATLMIEGKIKTLQNGQYTELLSKGSYRYEVNAEGHVSQNGTIVVDDDTQPLTIQLQSIVSTIDVVRQTFTVNGVSFNMILVEGGTFQMGATEEQLDDADNDEKPVHNVTLNDFMIGETEVTQELWEAVMDMNPSYFKGAKNPVERVNWLDCQEFISKLYSLTGERFRLPTEAEWEYAARGGNKSRKTKYSGSNTVDDVAWYVGNSSDTTHPVGTKQMNELGIYDMSGNVEEFCEDWYGEAYYSNSPHYHPKGPSQGSYRVVRGGCWFYGKQFCRVSNRDDEIPDRGERSSLLGLRLACSLNEDNDSDTNTIERHDKETASLSGNKASVEVPTEQSAKDASKATIVEEKDNIIPVNNNSIDEPVLVDGIEYPCETPTVE